MRTFLALVLMIALVGSVAAADLGTTQKLTKSNDHVGMNPGTPDGREGGEDMDSAVVIPSLPFDDTGNTVGHDDDYGTMCPYGSWAPDLWYSYTPVDDEIISVDLCYSTYDTAVFLIDGQYNLIACNDDYYFEDECGTYVSMIEEASLEAGTEYFIIIDGYVSDAGDYVVHVELFEPPVPCFLICDGVAEGEPSLGPGYDDAWNGGCQSPEFGSPFQNLEADSNGELIFCGIAGWTYGGRDTDWFTIIVGETGMVEWIVDAEQETHIFLLGPHDCDTVDVILSETAGICNPVTLLLEASPGDVLWIWVGATTYNPPSGFVGWEYNYTCTFTGLMPGTVSVQSISFDGIKSWYR